MIYHGKDLEKILFNHSIWILTKGRSGKLAALMNGNLDGANLEMANLPFAEMQLTSLKGASLQGANFRKAKLKQVKLSGARLDGADFEGANLSGADLSFTTCTGTNFADADLRDGNFVGAKLVETNFKGANLRGANFKNANFSFAELCNANLEDANFEGTYFNEANFEGAYLKGVNFENTNYQKANFRGAIFTGPITNDLNLPDTMFTYKDLNNLLSDSGIKTKTKKEELSVDSIYIEQSMIEEAFRELINKIRLNINDDEIKAICKEKFGIEKIDRIDFERGDIVTHNEQISFKLDFIISCPFSLLIDRRGNCTVFSSDNF
jgi:uncharacterized protein YjbI with pentapeptide repeats